MTHDEIALEKQIAKPLKLVRSLCASFKEYTCPCCEQNRFVTFHTIYPNYCDNCGQRLDWTEFRAVESEAERYDE
jgi:hypothetical protein